MAEWRAGLPVAVKVACSVKLCPSRTRGLEDETGEDVRYVTGRGKESSRSKESVRPIRDRCGGRRGNYVSPGVQVVVLWPSWGALQGLCHSMFWRTGGLAV